ncbi:MAG: hypothetical protein GQ582_02680 [Methyloprofundus sp.]|nr:hypothetical protein [Methyloprofundus sp.]
MMSLIQQYKATYFTAIETGILATSSLSGHDKASKERALQAIEILKEYKLNVNQFTDDIIDFWSLPKKVMERYHFSDVTELNEWLDEQLS